MTDGISNADFSLTIMETKTKIGGNNTMWLWVSLGLALISTVVSSKQAEESRKKTRDEVTKEVLKQLSKKDK